MTLTAALRQTGQEGEVSRMVRRGDAQPRPDPYQLLGLARRAEPAGLHLEQEAEPAGLHLEQELAALRALAARSPDAGPAAPDGSGDVG
jgi:hypothetical protein